MDHRQCVFICLLIASVSHESPVIRLSKLSIATWDSYYEKDNKGPGTYIYGYDIEDPATGNTQFKQEERHVNGTITGSYGFVDAEGNPVIVTYVSDQNGYRAKVERKGSPAQYFPSFRWIGGDSRRPKRDGMKSHRA